MATVTIEGQSYDCRIFGNHMRGRGLFAFTFKPGTQEKYVIAHDHRYSIEKGWNAVHRIYMFTLQKEGGEPSLAATLDNFLQTNFTSRPTDLERVRDMFFAEAEDRVTHKGWYKFVRKPITHSRTFFPEMTSDELLSQQLEAVTAAVARVFSEKEAGAGK